MLALVVVLSATFHCEAEREGGGGERARERESESERESEREREEGEAGERRERQAPIYRACMAGEPFHRRKLQTMVRRSRKGP